MSRHRFTDVRQLYSHKAVVGRAGPSATSLPALGVDAIIVPASRSAENLDHAIGLARDVDCHLVLLCSRDARADEVAQRLTAGSCTKATVIELRSEYSHGLFSFSTTDLADFFLPYKCAARDSDLSMKRNVGLALARMLGWQRVFFLDDDIRGLDSDALRYCVSMLAQYNTVGMWVTDFPDNSVVCHAHRRTGGHQDVHVSGSTLAVNCTDPIGFFPDIYNEDWLFFYNDAANGRLGSSGFLAKQLEYDPFADRERAARQEFGDVLAEGLYRLLQIEGHGNATRDYWDRFLGARKEFLNAILLRTGKAQPQIRDAVATALECLEHIRPERCESYIHYWRRDLKSWNERLTSISAAHSIDEALSQLGLKAVDINLSKASALHVDGSRERSVGTLVTPNMIMLNDLSARSPLLEDAGVINDRMVRTSRRQRAKPSLAKTYVGASDVSRAKLTDAGKVLRVLRRRPRLAAPHPAAGLPFASGRVEITSEDHHASTSMAPGP